MYSSLATNVARKPMKERYLAFFQRKKRKIIFEPKKKKILIFSTPLPDYSSSSLEQRMLVFFTIQTRSTNKLTKKHSPIEIMPITSL